MGCQLCKTPVPTCRVEFGMIAGILLFFTWRTTTGHLCKSCVNATFWTYTLITLFFGWWSIAFFAAPIVLIANLITYCRASFDVPVPDGALAPDATWETANKLRPYRDEMIARILKGETMVQVSEDVAKRTGVTPDAVRWFYNSSFGN